MLLHHLNRRTQAALDMWREMGDKASTPSTVVRTTKAAKKGADDRPSALSEASEESLAKAAAAPAAAATVAAK